MTHPFSPFPTTIPMICQGSSYIFCLLNQGLFTISMTTNGGKFPKEKKRPNHQQEGNELCKGANSQSLPIILLNISISFNQICQTQMEIFGFTSMKISSCPEDQESLSMDMCMSSEDAQAGMIDCKRSSVVLAKDRIPRLVPAQSPCLACPVVSCCKEGEVLPRVLVPRPREYQLEL